MLFTTRFHSLEKRQGSKSAFFLAHSSSFDKSGIIFFAPKDSQLLSQLEEFCEHNERLKDYEFSVTYSNFKDSKGGYSSRFSVIGVRSLDSPD